MAGYSGTTLDRKLGFRDNFRVRLINAPDNYFDLLPELPKTVQVIQDTRIKKNLIHYFSKNAEEFYSLLPELKNEIEINGMIWVSWPKKSSKVYSDLTEDFIRNYALKIGLVDIKVCSVDDVWSGLKLVIPLKHRKF
jgi:hypothetical protein